MPCERCEKTVILALETSSPQASLALYDAVSGEILREESFVTDRSHNSEIFGPLARLLDQCGRRLDLLAVGIGPGSYSGVRVAIAAANGICLALGCPVVPISSLEAYPGDHYWVAGDARRKSFFLAEVRNKYLQGEPQLMDEASLSENLCRLKGVVYTIDDSVDRKHQRVIQEHPRACEIAKRAARLYPTIDKSCCSAVEPHYLRPPFITHAKNKPVPGFGKV